MLLCIPLKWSYELLITKVISNIEINNYKSLEYIYNEKIKALLQSTKVAGVYIW